MTPNDATNASTMMSVSQVSSHTRKDGAWSERELRMIQNAVDVLDTLGVSAEMLSVLRGNGGLELLSDTSTAPGIVSNQTQTTLATSAPFDANVDAAFDNLTWNDFNFADFVPTDDTVEQGLQSAAESGHPLVPDFTPFAIEHSADPQLPIFGNSEQAIVPFDPAFNASLQFLSYPQDYASLLHSEDADWLAKGTSNGINSSIDMPLDSIAVTQDPSNTTLLTSDLPMAKWSSSSRPSSEEINANDLPATNESAIKSTKTNKDSMASKNARSRRGFVDPEERLGVARMRKIKACVQCSIAKVKVGHYYGWLTPAVCPLIMNSVFSSVMTRVSYVKRVLDPQIM